jgi:uncharacterized protein with PIN domain
MTALAFVSSTSVAAALCSHEDAQQHEVALGSGDRQVAAAAELEEAADALADRKGTLADAGSFALAAFILPDASLAFEHVTAKQANSAGKDAPNVRSSAPPPLLEPPAA